MQLGSPSNFPSSIVFAPVKKIPRKKTVDHLLILGCIAHLVGGWTNPFEKYAQDCASQIGSFPLGSGWKFQKYLSCHHPVIWIHYEIICNIISPTFPNTEQFPLQNDAVTSKNPSKENVTWNCQKVPRLRTFPSPAAPALWHPRSHDLFVPLCSGDIGRWCVLGMCSEKLQIPRGSVLLGDFLHWLPKKQGQHVLHPATTRGFTRFTNFYGGCKDLSNSSENMDSYPQGFTSSSHQDSFN